MRVSGTEIAQRLYESLEAERAALLHAPRLGIVLSAGDAVTDSYVRIKTRAAARLGVGLVRRELAADATTDDAVAAVEALIRDNVDGIIVQLPLSPRIDAARVIAAVPSPLDVDALNPGALVVAPVAGAVAEILAHAGVGAAGKRAVVIGAGRLVGAPVAAWLRSRGADVSVITAGASFEVLQSADIIVSGAGRPGLISPDMIKEGVVLIDAGTSESAGKLAGDADTACEDKASVFTPVPGGVGPVAIAMIYRNLFALMK